MKKKVIAGSLALLAVTAMYAQTYQLPNVGFEDWEKAGKSLSTFKSTSSESEFTTIDRSNSEPTSWSSSNIFCSASANELVFQRDNTTLGNYALIVNKQVGNTKGYIPTVGLLTCGSSWVETYYSSVFGLHPVGNNIDPDVTYNNKFAQNGTYGGIVFIGRPDALSYEVLNNSKNAHIVAYLWKGTFHGSVPANLSRVNEGKWYNPSYRYYIDSWCNIKNLDRAIWSQIDPSIVTSETVQNITKSDDAAIIAYVDKAYTANSSDWTTDVINLNYLSDAAPEMTNVIIAAGYPWDSRKSVKEESINVDNIRYV